MNPKISVIVPVYNVEKYLKKCLNSLVKQTLKDIEILVINDGSTDKSQKIIDDFVKKYSAKVKGYKKKNGGLSDARNYGLKKAKGEYIAFVDSDDWIRKDAYEKMYKKAKNYDFDIVACDLLYVYDEKTKAASCNIQNDTFDKDKIKKLYGRVYPAAWNKIYKKELFTDEKIRFKKGVWYEDVEFMYKIFPYINSMGVVHEEFYYYVQRSNSISNTYDKRLYDEIDNWNGLVDFYKENDLFEDYKKELEYAYVSYVCGSFIKQCANYPDKEEYKLAVKAAIENTKNKFPKYRRNKLFYQNGIKGIYLVLFSMVIARIYYFLKNRR